MANKTIYCSACDREVVIKLRPDGQLEGSICMDIGEACTGTLCPICAEPPAVIRRKATELRKQEPDAAG